MAGGFPPLALSPWSSWRDNPGQRTASTPRTGSARGWQSGGRRFWPPSAGRPVGPAAQPSTLQQPRARAAGDELAGRPALNCPVLVHPGTAEHARLEPVAHGEAVVGRPLLLAQQVFSADDVLDPRRVH